MRHIKLAFIGFGNVGKALARLFLDQAKGIDRDLTRFHSL